MSITIADAAVAIAADFGDGAFEDSIIKAAGGAGSRGGDEASKTFGERLKAGVGAAAGAAFGMAIGQGGKLNDVMSTLASKTGVVGDEAGRMQTSLAHAYENNLQGLTSIGDVMATVYTGMHLTGDAADYMTERILKFATATGQEAGPVASDFDKILKAFNLTADQTPLIMDKLVAAHEKYNIVVPDSQAALVAMAPSLNAMNMSVDDGIALLDLFETAGISAAKAPMALAKAVKELKPGENINDLIRQISSIEDPTLRAQKAMEVFGVKGGTQFAQAFKPGIDSLDQFKISTDEAADATNKAAEASLSWSDRGTLAIHKISGAFGEFGTNLGPLLTVTSLMGSKLPVALMAGLGGLGPKIAAKIAAELGLTLPTWIAGGAAEGVAAGEAAVGAEAATVAAGGPEVAAGLAAQTGEVVVAGGLMGGSLGTAIGAAAALALPIALGAAVGFVLGEVASNLLGLPSVFTEGKVKRDGAWVDPIASQVSHNQPSTDYSGMGTDQLQASLDKQTALWQSHAADVKWYSSPEGLGLRANIQKTQQVLDDQKASMPNPFADMAAQTAVGLDSTERLVRLGLGHMEQDAAGAWQFIAGVVAPAMTTWNGAVRLGLSEVVASFRQAQSDMEKVWSGALDDQARHQQIADEETINLAGQRDKTLLANLKSKDGAVRAAADEQLLNLKTAYMKLLVEDTKYGTDAQKKAKLAALLQSSALKAGLSDSNPDVASMWADVQTTTQAQLDALVLGAEAKGKAAGEGFADALGDADLLAYIASQVAKWTAILAPLGSGWSYDPSGAHPVYNTPAPTNGGSYVPPAGPVKFVPGNGTPAKMPPSLTGHPDPMQGLSSGTPFVERAGVFRTSELGSEDVYLPRGAAVVPHGQTMGGGDTYHTTLNMPDARNTNPADALRLAARWVRMGHLTPAVKGVVRG